MLSLITPAADTTKGELRVESAILTLIEHADISARETGPLILREVKEGDAVEQGALLGKLDDNDARLLRERAETEVKIAKLVVENDIKIRYARKSHDVANSELKRSLASVEKFPVSVTNSELDQQRLLVEKAALEIEQAQADLEQAKLTLQIKQNDFDRADLLMERRTIRAPFPGIVVQWKRQRGEWVEPGVPIVRLIRLNRLRAEAFLTLNDLSPNLSGRRVTLTVPQAGKSPSTYRGKIIFVDPEIDPVNRQFRIAAEIDNSALVLRPGQTAAMTIHSEQAEAGE